MNYQEQPQEAQATQPSIKHYFGSVRAGRHHWWHWLTGVWLMLIVFCLLMFFLVLVFEICEALIGFKLTVVDGDEFAILVGLLLSFVAAFAAIAVVQKFWHQRPVVTGLVTSASKFRWGNLFRAMVVVFVLMFLFSPVSIWLSGDWNRISINGIWPFLIGILVLVPLVPIQSACEELFFRGYLNQALSKYLTSPILVYLTTCLLFSVGHAYNEEAQSQILPYLIVIFTFAVGACVLLHLEGGLESAMGYHIANNLFVFCFLGCELEELPELSLFYIRGNPGFVMLDAVCEVFMVAGIVALTLAWNRHAADQRD